MLLHINIFANIGLIVVSCQLSVVSCQLSVVSCQLLIVNSAHALLFEGHSNYGNFFLLSL
jgi:hypothetical protein